jgi:hypothetical protein
MRRKRDESWSTWKAKGIVRSPECIKVKRLATWVLPFLTSRKIRMLTTKEASIVPQPIMLTSGLGSCFLNNPLRIKPNSGNKGTNQTKLSIVLINRFTDNYQLNALAG